MNPAGRDIRRSYPILGIDPATRYPIIYRGDGHLLMLARSGAGKSRGISIPNGILSQNSMIVTDFNNEIARAIALWRSYVLGHEVHVVDPFHAVPDKYLPKRNGKPYRATFDPIGFITATGNEEDAATRAYLIADALVVTESKNLAYWDNAARSYGVGFELHVALSDYYDSCPENRTMSEFWRILNSEEKMLVALACMAESGDMHRVSVANALIDAPADDKEQRSIKSTLRNNCTRILSDSRIGKAMQKSTIPFMELKDRPVTVILVLPGHLAQVQSRFPRIMILCALSEIERSGRIAYNSTQGPVLFLLEEFAVLQNFPPIVAAMDRLRGAGVQFMVIAQSLSQLRDLYGESWERVLGSMGVVAYWGGTADSLTAQRISQLIGKQTIIKTSVGSNAGGKGMSTNVNRSPESWDVLMPDQIANLPLPKSTITYIGTGTVIGEVIHPSLEDFPAYLTFMEHIEAGHSPEFAAEQARIVEASMAVRSMPPVHQQHRQHQPASQPVKRKSFWSGLDSIAASILGDD